MDSRKDYLTSLVWEFERQANPTIAAAQKAYMRDQFEYFGIKTQLRRTIQKPFLAKTNLPHKSELEQLVRILWDRPERDFQQFGQELTYKYVKQFEVKDIRLMEFMVVHKSWWDTVDYIAVKLMGSYFKKYPEQRQGMIVGWLKTDNMWLHRCCLLFQLKYKSELDQDLLAKVITQLLGSREFFVNKAIGWVLREYSKTNPEWVCNFARDTNLSPLSTKEALRLIQ